jgi:putative membrane protein
MIRFLTWWFTLAVALGCASWLLGGVRVESGVALAVASLVLGMVNTLIRPVMVLLTLPVTVLTLGLFYLVVNGVAFGLAAWVVPGFDVDGFGWAVVGALVTGLVSWFVGALLRPARTAERD